MECIFCKIISGDIPSSKVYEDDNFIAILDIRPVHFGHTLVIPKKHFKNIYDTPEDIAIKIYSVLIKIAKSIKKTLDCDGINIVQNNEASAGQEVFHSHIHLIPRYENDGIRFSPKHKSYESIEVMNEMAKKISSNL